MAAQEDNIVLVVQGRRIQVDRASLALVSKFFKALFSHQFEDSRAPVLHLDAGGEMGLTVAAVKILAEFAQTRQINISDKFAVQIFIAADALDVAIARESAETFLGSNMLKTETNTFLSFWQMSQIFHMKILEQFLDDLCVNNFGWFCTSLGRGGTLQYLQQWDLTKLAMVLQEKQFNNCCEEQIFNAVVSYCRAKGDTGDTFEQLVPGLYKSCGAYLRYLQSVPRMIPFKLSKQ